MMRFLDFTLNNVTMLALVLMVGVVIDDAIVVLENVFHCIEEKGMTPMQAAVAGTKEIGLAVLVTTLSLVIVFLPVSFLSSVTGRMLYPVRHDGDRGDPGLDAGELLADADDVLAAAAAGAGRRPAAPASRRGFYHWIEVGYMALSCAGRCGIAGWCWPDLARR